VEAVSSSSWGFISADESTINFSAGYFTTALPARPNAIASDAVITGIVSVCHRDASVLFDLGSTFSYVSSYFAHYLGTPHESLTSYVHVSTPVGDTVVVDHVYQSCVVTIGGLETRVDLLLL